MVIETYYNPMGAFTYKKYNEEEEDWKYIKNMIHKK
jgi:hypothetical protein